MDGGRRALHSVLQQREEHLWKGAAQVVPPLLMVEVNVDNEQHLQEVQDPMPQQCAQLPETVLVQTN